MSIQVSVVVPTCRRPDLLRRCLEALLEQELDPDCYEVIVVNDAPDLLTRQVAEQAAHQAAAAAGCVRYLANTGPRGPAAARNLGWQAARGEIIAFTDDDCLPAPAWLTSALRCFTAGVDGVNGRVIVPLPPRPTDYELNAAGLETSDFVTANCFYRRAALAALGGFDQDFPLAWLEDRELWFRMLKNGARLVDAPDAVVIHPVRPAAWGVSLQQQRKSMYNALLYKKHPDLFVRLQPPPPWRYYAILNCLAGMLVGAIAGSPPAFGLWAALWAGFTLSFCLQRLKGASHRPGHVLEMLVTSALIPALSVYWRLRGAWRFKVFFL